MKHTNDSVRSAPPPLIDLRFYRRPPVNDIVITAASLRRLRDSITYLANRFVTKRETFHFNGIRFFRQPSVAPHGRMPSVLGIVQCPKGVIEQPEGGGHANSFSNKFTGIEANEGLDQGMRSVTPSALCFTPSH
ncbi:hypothetical protein NPIL_303591 [Nephila pilipes]|uniref:Uncharacterized protein n=1 Tax=Nephila pilipes TaxID=299642 RepID=A0A8X6QFV3_NEPPI|nr:hypothetical protein NPIL_303591 [Nephila pilipes]